MFLVTSPELVIESSKAGVIGALPAANARSIDILDVWMNQIYTSLKEDKRPWMLNMIVHSSYDRFESELEIVKRYQPPIVSTALGSPARVTESVKSYGGKVFADVITPTMAKKSIAAGVDGLILVCKGAGGHTGQYNPLAFISEVRKFWTGYLGVAGCISYGSDILAMLCAGSDFVVAGTRFITAKESLANSEYKNMVINSSLEDILESKLVSGVQANWLKASLEKANFITDASTNNKTIKPDINFSGDIASATKAWKDVWSAGQGVGAINHEATAKSIINNLYQEFINSKSKINSLVRSYSD